jgi:hypothetical protein
VVGGSEDEKVLDTAYDVVLDEEGCRSLLETVESNELDAERVTAALRAEEDREMVTIIEEDRHAELSTSTFPAIEPFGYVRTTKLVVDPIALQPSSPRPPFISNQTIEEASAATLLDRTKTPADGSLSRSGITAARRRHITTNKEIKNVCTTSSTEIITSEVDRVDCRSVTFDIEPNNSMTITAAAAVGGESCTRDEFLHRMVHPQTPIRLPLETTKPLAATESRRVMLSTTRRCCGHPDEVAFTRNTVDPPTTPSMLC